MCSKLTDQSPEALFSSANQISADSGALSLEKVSSSRSQGRADSDAMLNKKEKVGKK